MDFVSIIPLSLCLCLFLSFCRSLTHSVLVLPSVGLFVCVSLSPLFFSFDRIAFCSCLVLLSATLSANLFCLAIHTKATCTQRLQISTSASKDPVCSLVCFFYIDLQPCQESSQSWATFVSTIQTPIESSTSGQCVPPEQSAFTGETVIPSAATQEPEELNAFDN